MKKLFLACSKISIISTFLFGFMTRAFAQGGLIYPEPLEPLQGIDIESLVATIISWVLYIAGALAVIYLIYSGILYITAGGDTEKATKGRTGVINAVIGIVIVLLCVVLVRFIQNSLESPY